MSAQSSSLLGYGLYFIDVLACLLFCITLALVGARFGREQTVAVELPELERAEGPGAELSGSTITLRARSFTQGPGSVNRLSPTASTSSVNGVGAKKPMPAEILAVHPEVLPKADRRGLSDPPKRLCSS